MDDEPKRNTELSRDKKRKEMTEDQGKEGLLSFGDDKPDPNLTFDDQTKIISDLNKRLEDNIAMVELLNSALLNAQTKLKDVEIDNRALRLLCSKTTH